MDLLSHRGLWCARHEQNTLEAFRRSWRAGHGIETDLRDREGEVVVSHDPAVGGVLSLEELVRAYTDEGHGSVLALNVKSDGLAARATEVLTAEARDRSFCFDMSIPDLMQWLGSGVAAYTRWSDVEPDPVLVEEASGIWLDSMRRDCWWDQRSLTSYLEGGLRVVVVSSDLHGRDVEQQWGSLRSSGLAEHPGLSLCTDRVDEARRWFQ